MLILFKKIKLSLITLPLVFSMSFGQSLTPEESIREMESTLDVISTVLKNGLDTAVPGAMMSGKDAPLVYGKRKRLFNIMIRLPVSANFGLMSSGIVKDLLDQSGIVDTIKDNDFVTQFTAGGTVPFPLPLFSADVYLRINAVPILKKFDIGLRFNGVPSIRNLTLAPLNIKDFELMSISGSLRFMFLRTPAIRLAVAGGFNTFFGKMKIAYSPDEFQIAPSINSAFDFSFQNRFEKTALSLDLVADAGLRNIVQIYGGLGVVLPLTYRNEVNYNYQGTISSTLFETNDVSFEGNKSIATELKDYAKLIPRLNIGLKLSIFNLSVSFIPIEKARNLSVKGLFAFPF